MHVCNDRGMILVALVCSWRQMSDHGGSRMRVVGNVWIAVQGINGKMSLQNFTDSTTQHTVCASDDYFQNIFLIK